MKKTTFIGFFILLANYNFSQKKSIVFFEEQPQVSVVNCNTLKQNYANSFILRLVHGKSIFNQKHELLLIDAKTLEEKAKIDYPKTKGYNYLNFGLDITEDIVKDNFIVFSEKKDPITKKINIYVNKISEQFIIPETPVFLFSLTPDDFKNSRNDSHLKWFEEHNSQSQSVNYPDNSISCYINEKRDLILFSYEGKPQKNVPQKNYYYLFDNNFKLLHADSLVSSSKDYNLTYNIISDEGYVTFIKRDYNTDLKIFNTLKNNSNEFSIKTKKTEIYISSIKKMNEKYILCGNYFEKNNEKKIFKNGIFKLVYNTKSKTIEDEIYFEHEPKGKIEMEQFPKKVYFSHITDSGICFVGICQRYISIGTENNINTNNSEITEIRTENKYEIMCINKDNLWTKQLPIGPRRYREFYYLNNTIFIKCYVNKKINPNNYIYDEKLSLKNNSYDINTDAYLSILKVNASGDIKHHTIFDESNQETSNWYSEVLYTGTVKTKPFNFKKISLTE